MEVPIAAERLIKRASAGVLTQGSILCLFLLLGWQPLGSAQSAAVTDSNHSASAGHSERTSSDGRTLPDLEGAVHGFPAVLGLDGKRIGDGEFVQWLEGGSLHATVTYDLGPHHRIEEKAVFREEPKLVQQEWSWHEWQNGQLSRHFEVNFATGKATAEKREGNKMKRWSETVKIIPG